jgi:peptidylprolyl isomerase
VGSGRDADADSGGGTELYVVIGHSPRHLDRNVTLVGRVVKGMELLSTLRRGTGALGFYEKAEERTPIHSIRVAADLPESERMQLEVIRTDTATFAALVESRRNRSDDWFKYKAGHVDVCNVPVAVRARPATSGNP